MEPHVAVVVLFHHFGIVSQKKNLQHLIGVIPCGFFPSSLFFLGLGLLFVTGKRFSLNFKIERLFFVALAVHSFI